MATKTILDSTLTAIADAIRQKTGDSGSMTPLEMPEEIENIPTGGGGDTLDEVLLSHTATSYTNNTFAGTVPPYTFYNAASLTEVKMSNATVIDSSAFYGCSGLSTVNFPSVTKILGSVFSSAFANDAEPSFPAVTEIGGNAFSNSKIKSITLPNVTNLANGVFYNCTRLKSVTFPKTLTNFGNQIFRNCSALESVVFGGDLPSAGIYSKTFAGCTACTLYDFSHCTVVPPLLNTDVFTDINANAKIVVPDDLYNDWIAATNWSTYASYIVKASEA